MAKIKIISNDDNLILNFRFYTPQQYFYSIIILNNKTGEILYKSQGQWDDQTSFQIGKAKNLLGNLLTIHWSVIDTAGKGKNFNAEAIVTQNNAECLDHLTCIGKTNDTTTYIPTNGLFIQ